MQSIQKKKNCIFDYIKSFKNNNLINRFFLIFFFFFSTANAIEFQGKFLQGHFILGKTNPGAKIIVGKKEVRVSQDGFFVFGIDRDQKYLSLIHI